MSPRLHTVYSFDGPPRTYTGFNKDFHGEHDLVLVMVEGQPEAWAVDGVSGFERLLAFLESDDYRREHVEVVGRYKPERFRGVLLPKGLREYKEESAS